MNLRLLCLITSLLLLASAFGASSPTKVLLVTGGHGYKTNEFLAIFKENPAITLTHAQHKKDADAYERADFLDHDVIVIYDMPKNITETQQQRFKSIFEKGKGLVVLHHALCSFQKWPEYEQLIGGRYAEPSTEKSGVVTADVGYQHDVQVPVVIANKNHPVTAGLSNFIIHDEIYWGFRVGSNVTPLLTTTHPKSGKTLSWTLEQGKSKVVYLQLGHGPEAFANPNYRKLVAQSIAYVAPK